MDALIHHLENREDLEPREITVAAEFLLDEAAGLPKKKRLLKALAAKGETAAEIAEFVAVFLEKAVKPDFLGQTFEGPTIDVCGTGGDKLDLFNISTTSMFVVAAAGATVIKHGNRGVTSKSGSSDVLSELGIPLDLSSEKVGECLGKAGVGFLFAPLYHPAFKAVAPVRAELAKEGVRTIFNLIGPLLNPAQPECQLVGVMDEALCPVFADILQRMGRDSAWVVNGSTADGRAVDEVSLMGPSRIYKSGSFQGLVDEEIHPSDFDLEIADIQDLKGGNSSENAVILKDILSGKDKGPKRDIVVLNAAAAIACAGLEDNMEAAMRKASSLIDEGEALERLVRLQECAG